MTTLTANWIWRAGDPAPRNVLMQFRRTFSLDAPPAQVQFHVSADTRYFLTVNGVRLGYGPARSYHFHYEYDTYNLAPYLRAGQNILAVAVSHWGEATFQQMVGRGGLLAQLDLDGQTRLRTDASWKVKRSAAVIQNTPRIACQLPWEEQIDGRLEDQGWTDAGFDDSAWEPAVLVGPLGVAPWGQLSPRAIPFLTDERVTPVRARALGLAQRPPVVAAIHAGPYLAPGDTSANRHVVDGLIATVFNLPRAGEVTFKRNTNAGGDAPRMRLDGVEVAWQPADCDTTARVGLAAGDHVCLFDWNNLTHDMDFTVTAGGQPGPAVRSPHPGSTGTWAIAVKPGAARAAAHAAATLAALLACGADWQPVSPLDTPAADVYMEMTASTLAAAERPVHLPLRIPPAPAGHAQRYLFDFGRLVMGWIEFEVEAPAGTMIDVLGYEGVQEGRPQITSGMNNTLRYICRAGRQTFRSTLRRGARFLIVSVHDDRTQSVAAETVLHSLSLSLSTYPWDIQGAFRSSDPRLNQIWEQCAYTLRLCSEDTFTDCPTYEQTFWVGDACGGDIPVHLTVHGDPRLPRRVLLLAADSLQRLPITGSQVPGDWENDLLPNWSFFWAMGCAEFYLYTGDVEFARLVYPAMAKQAAFIEGSRNAAGLVALPGFWHLLDWANIPDGANEILPHESCLAAGAFAATAKIALAAGQPEAAAHWQALTVELAEAVNRECWRDDRQGYGDLWRPGGVPGPEMVTASYGMSQAPANGVSQPTNMAALIGGVATPARAAAILHRLIDCPPDWTPTGTPWIHALAGEQVARRGHLAPVLDTIRDRWGDMLDKGSGTAWELFAGFEGMAGWWTRSWCHAWSAYPAYLLPAYALGIRPLAVGFTHALIAPQLCDLAWVEGRVPTPHGPISLRAEQSALAWLAQITLPPGVSGEVHVPAGDILPLVTGAKAQIERAGAEYVIQLPPGAEVRIECARAAVSIRA